MFRNVILAVLFFAIASHARPQAEEPELQVLRNFNDGSDDKIDWGYEFSDGQKVEQKGYVKNAGTDNEMTIITMGSYTVPLADGRTMKVDYISDENGYQPTITFI